MTTKQISIFLENRSGTLVKVLQALKSNGIRLIALTIADTSDYGILRIICDSPDKAYEVLRAERIAVSQCDVFVIRLEDGGTDEVSKAVGIFASEGISIAYMYSFFTGDAGTLVFRTDNIEQAREIIGRNGFRTGLL